MFESTASLFLELSVIFNSNKINIKRRFSKESAHTKEYYPGSKECRIARRTRKKIRRIENWEYERLSKNKRNKLFIRTCSQNQTTETKVLSTRCPERCKVYYPLPPPPANNPYTLYYNFYVKREQNRKCTKWKGSIIIIVT